jgi:TrpR-related protein YerC/YecD
MNWKSKENRNLIKAVLSLKTAAEAESFLRDLMTESEIKEFVKRLKTAEMLVKKISYSAIEKETGLSSTTVARVSKWLNEGNGGYKAVLNKLHHASTPSKERSVLMR